MDIDERPIVCRTCPPFKAGENPKLKGKEVNLRDRISFEVGK
jgi:hypothetical protein